MAFKIGAGSIRAYPHAENTGLVISDGAKIGTFSDTSKLFANFLLIEAVFAKNIAGGELIALAVPPGDIADGVATADQDACLML